jgi:hypothetical protein
MQRKRAPVYKAQFYALVVQYKKKACGKGSNDRRKDNKIPQAFAFPTR